MQDSEWCDVLWEHDREYAFGLDCRIADLNSLPSSLFRWKGGESGFVSAPFPDRLVVDSDESLWEHVCTVADVVEIIAGLRFGPDGELSVYSRFDVMPLRGQGDSVGGPNLRCVWQLGWGVFYPFRASEDYACIGLWERAVDDASEVPGWLSKVDRPFIACIRSRTSPMSASEF